MKGHKNKWNKKTVLTAGVVLILLLVLGAGFALHSASSDHKKTDAKQKKDSQSEQQETEQKAPEETSEQAVSEEPEETSEQAVQEATPPAADPGTEGQQPFVYAESEGARKVYLTFDDGTSKQTDRILDILAQYGIKATFFVTAQGGEQNAARYQRIVSEGHSIGLHSVSHSYSTVYASMDSFIADVEGIRQFVFNTTGVDSHLYRFPGGSSNTVSNVPMDDCIRYLNQNGYRYFDWNIDTSDAVSSHQTVDQFLANIFNERIDRFHNTVILMHDAPAQETTVQALPAVIEGLIARGFEILPITEATPPVQHRKVADVQ